MHNSASAIPAAKPPGASTPASITRAPLGERVHGDAQFGRARDASVGNRPRALVHAEIGSRRDLHRIMTCGFAPAVTDPFREQVRHGRCGRGPRGGRSDLARQLTRRQSGRRGGAARDRRSLTGDHRQAWTRRTEPPHHLPDCRAAICRTWRARRARRSG